MSDWEITGSKPSKNNSEWVLSEDYQPNSVGVNVPVNPKESFLSKLPRNVLAGLAQGGHKLLNTPHDVAQLLEQQFGDYGKKLSSLNKIQSTNPLANFKLSEHIPYQEEKNFAEMLGQKGAPTFADTAIQKGVEYLPDLLLARNALGDLIPHLTRRGASRNLRAAERIGRERGINPLNIDTGLIEDARQFMPDTAPFRNLLDAAHRGEYGDLFNLQSELGSRANTLSRSKFSPAERMHGREGLAARERLLDAIHNQLESTGNTDISNLLRQGRNDYRRYARFRPYRNYLGVAAGVYALPKNALIDLVKKLYFVSND